MHEVIPLTLLAFFMFAGLAQGLNYFYKGKSEVSGNGKNDLHTAGIPVYNDSIRSASYIRSQIVYNRKFPFINYNLNYPEWTGPNALGTFFDALSHADVHKVRILHIGDSHVQTDVYPGTVREGLQRIFGSGGRGFIFPYSAAGTHSAYDYGTKHRGRWTYSRNIHRDPVLSLGLHGAAVRTTDSSAGFTFRFLPGIIKPGFDVLKIYCKKSAGSYDVQVRTSGIDTIFTVSCSADTEALYSTLSLPRGLGDTIEVRMVKTRPEQSFFECYGLLIESSANSGVLYGSVGINGADYGSILRQKLLGRQLAEFDPDLIIMDVGINEFYPRDLKPEFAHRMNMLMDTLQKYAPNASFIIPCSQDVRYKVRKAVRPVRGVLAYAQIAEATAAEKGAAFYNWFNVTGRMGEFSNWRSHKLIKSDNIHLSYEGYKVKGELALNALLGSYYLMLDRGFMDDTFTAADFPDAPVGGGLRMSADEAMILRAEADADIEDNAPEAAPTRLSEVSPILPEEKADKPVKNEKTAAIFGTKPVPDSSLIEASGKHAARFEKFPEPVMHEVKSGENLSVIARHAKVKVAELKKWNRMKENSLLPGMILALYPTGTPALSPDMMNVVKPASKKKTHKADKAADKEDKPVIAAKLSKKTKSKKASALADNSVRPGGRKKHQQEASAKSKVKKTAKKSKGRAEKATAQVAQGF